MEKVSIPITGSADSFRPVLFFVFIWYIFDRTYLRINSWIWHLTRVTPCIPTTSWVRAYGVAWFCRVGWSIYFLSWHSILCQKFCCIYYKILLVEASSSKWLARGKRKRVKCSVYVDGVAWPYLWCRRNLVSHLAQGQRTLPAHASSTRGRYKLFYSISFRLHLTTSFKHLLLYIHTKTGLAGLPWQLHFPKNSTSYFIMYLMPAVVTTSSRPLQSWNLFPSFVCQ